MSGGCSGELAQPATIADVGDPRLNDFRRLTDTSWRRRFEVERNCVIAEGVPLVARVSSRHEPRVVLVALGAQDRPDVVAIVRAHAGSVAFVDSALLEEVVGFEFRRGVMASFERPAGSSLETVTAGSGPVVVIEAVNDGENLGAICRSALAFGAAGVVLDPRCPDPYYRRTIRVSMGAVLDLPIARSSNWAHTLDQLRDMGRVLIALTTRPTAKPIEDVAAEVDANRAAIVLGSEGTGLSPDTVDAADFEAHIATSSMVDSLNVGHAAAIALHRFVAPK